MERPSQGWCTGGRVSRGSQTRRFSVNLRTSPATITGRFRRIWLYRSNGPKYEGNGHQKEWLPRDGKIGKPNAQAMGPHTKHNYRITRHWCQPNAHADRPPSSGSHGKIMQCAIIDSSSNLKPVHSPALCSTRNSLRTSNGPRFART